MNSMKRWISQEPVIAIVDPTLIVSDPTTVLSFNIYDVTSN